MDSTSGKKDDGSCDFIIKELEREFSQTEDFFNFKEKKKQSDILTQMINKIDLHIEERKQPVYFYYKRWIWMNFPLICLSNQEMSFSDIIQKLYSPQGFQPTYLDTLNFYCQCL